MYIAGRHVSIKYSKLALNCAYTKPNLTKLCLKSEILSKGRQAVAKAELYKLGSSISIYCYYTGFSALQF